MQAISTFGRGHIKHPPGPTGGGSPPAEEHRRYTHTCKDTIIKSPAEPTVVHFDENSYLAQLGLERYLYHQRLYIQHLQAQSQGQPPRNSIRRKPVSNSNNNSHPSTNYHQVAKYPNLYHHQNAMSEYPPEHRAPRQPARQHGLAAASHPRSSSEPRSLSRSATRTPPKMGTVGIIPPQPAAPYNPNSDVLLSKPRTSAPKYMSPHFGPVGPNANPASPSKRPMTIPMPEEHIPMAPIVQPIENPPRKVTPTAQPDPVYPGARSKRAPPPGSLDFNWSGLVTSGMKFFRPPKVSPPYESRRKELSMPSPPSQTSPTPFPAAAAGAVAAAVAAAGAASALSRGDQRMFGRPPPNHFPTTWAECYDWFIHFIRMTPILRDALDFVQWLSMSEYKVFTPLATVICVILLMMALHYTLILLESCIAVIRFFCLPAVVLGKFLFRF